MPDCPPASELLAPGGAVARAMPGFESRPQQLDMARAIERALEGRKIVVIEAGTGTGKSFGYLFALVLHALKTKRPAIVSSSTHVLQDQLIRKDVPFVQRVLAEYGVEFRAAEVKGMGAYLCRLALAEQAGSLLVEHLEHVTKLDEWVEHAVEGTRSEAPWVPAEVWAQMAAERETCLREKCRFYESCFFYQARQRVTDAHLLVTNHSLVFADLSVKEEGGRVLPEYSVLVLDEAQNVEDSATSFLGSSFTPRGIRMILHRLYDPRGHGALPALEQIFSGAKELPAAERRALPAFVQRQVYPELAHADQAVDTAFAEIENAYHALAAGRERRGGAASNVSSNSGDKALRLTPRIYQDPAFAQAQAAAHHLAARLELAANRVGQVLRRAEVAENLLNQRDFLAVRAAGKGLLSRAQEIKEFFDSTSGMAETVKWLQPEHSKKGFQLRFASAPLDVAPHLEQRLFKKLDACVLTSATLAVARRFDYIAERLGLAGEMKTRVETALLDSPFAYKTNVLIGVPDDLPEPNSVEFIQEAARFIWQALKMSRGRSLVLFHSWYTLRATWKLIEPHAEQLGFQILRQGQQGMSKNQLIETFREDVHSALLATTSYREGIDVPGEALSNLILHRLPFPVPDEPVVEARMERIEENGGSSFDQFELPAAAISFKQAFGRLIRRHSDYGLFFCLDKRVVTRRYGTAFLGTLPPAELLRGPKRVVLARAAQFLAQRDAAPRQEK